MDSTFDAGTADSSLTGRKSAGALLRDARKLKGFSKEKVASHLNLMPSHILALESDAYNPDLEGRHFVDYLTAYANLVDLNPRALKDLYRDNSDNCYNEDTVNFSSEPYEPLVTRRQTYRDLSFSSHQAGNPAAVGGAGLGSARMPGSNAFAFRIATVLALVCLAWLVTARGIGPDQLMASLKAAFAEDADQPFKGQIMDQGTGTAQSNDRQDSDRNTVAAESSSSLGSLDRSRWSTPEWANTSEDSVQELASSNTIDGRANDDRANDGRANDSSVKAQLENSAIENSAIEKSETDQIDADLAAFLARTRDYAERVEPAAGTSRPAKVDSLHAEASQAVAATGVSITAAAAESSTTVAEPERDSLPPAALASAGASGADQDAAALLLASADIAGYTEKTEADRLDASVQALTNVVSGAGEDVMVFTFYDSCWIEVYDHQQNPLVMDTKMPGEVLRIAGRAPFEVRVGNSRVVGLTLNGRAVAIERHPTIASTELIVGKK